MTFNVDGFANKNAFFHIKFMKIYRKGQNPVELLGKFKNK